jgi:hypothetical protein
MPHRAIRRAAAFCSLALAVGACTDRTPLEAELQPPNALLSSTLTSLLECSTTTGWSATVDIGPEGFQFSGDGVRITVPPRAVPEPTRFTITVPASRYVEFRMKANGWDGYVFQQPITVRLSYDRCLTASLLGGLGVWYVDGETRRPLEFKGGSDDRLRRRLTFRTDHLSGYAIAN